jgi:hypothetical protein
MRSTKILRNKMTVVFPRRERAERNYLKMIKIIQISARLFLFSHIIKWKERSLRIKKGEVL